MMRHDSQGLFWSNPVAAPKAGKGKGADGGGGVNAPRAARVEVARMLPEVPDTGWTLPSSFPRLESAKALCIDVETHDIGLEQGKGPGWAWDGGGEVIGLSVGTDDGSAWYFPIEGRVDGMHRRGLPRVAVMGWAYDELRRESQPKVGTNLMYDLGWLRREGVPVTGQCHDVQFAEPLLDEHADSYALGTLAEKYGLTEAGEGKGADEKALYQWLAVAYGGNPDRRGQAKNIWRGPSELVGPYALGDVTLPFHILRKQIVELNKQGLIAVYDMERALIPMYVEMRWKGIRVDVEAAIKRGEWLEKEIKRVRALMGHGADPNSNIWLAAAFDKAGIRYNRTAPSKSYPTGQPSFTGAWLEGMAKKGIPLAKQIMDVRRLEKVKGTFIDGHIIGHAQNGRLHCSFHPLKGDENGTVSGRLSSSDPNLQQIPSRDKEIKMWTRGLFLPEEGQRLFSPDYSQLEYRLMVHGAVGPGAKEAVEKYNTEPRTDYHTMVQAMIQELTGRLLPRKIIKNTNFGKIFGMGERKLIETIGFSQEEAHEFFVAYDKGVPFAKGTLSYFSKLAARMGEIRTVSGRKARFPFWEAKKFGARAKMYRSESEARGAVDGDIIRALTHKALNAYTQGGGGDCVKAAMLACWEQGECPVLTVHDELVASIEQGAEGTQRAKRIIDAMQGVRDRFKISVPLLVSGKVGPNWADMVPMYFAGDSVTVHMPAVGYGAGRGETGEKWAGEVIDTDDTGTQPTIYATDQYGDSVELSGGWDRLE